MNRAYVITEQTGRGVIDSSRTITVKSNRKKAIASCEDLLPNGLWEIKDKHKGKLLGLTGTNTSVTYEMFYVND